MSKPAIIRVELDTAQAEAAVKRLRDSLENASRVAARASGGGGGVSASAGVGGAIGGFAGSLLAQLVASVPFARDGGDVVGAAFGGLADMTNYSYFRANKSAAESARDRTIQAFGSAGYEAGEGSVREVFQNYRRLEQMRTYGAARITEILRPDVLENQLPSPMLNVLTEIRDILRSSGRGPGAGR
jgi:hypothetical protein